MSCHTRCIRAEFSDRYIRMFYANGLSFKEVRTPAEERLRLREASADGAIIVRDEYYVPYKRKFSLWFPAAGIAAIVAVFCFLFLAAF